MTGMRAMLALAACLPAMAAGERCPWLNAATAAGVLGGPARATVTPASCEFARQGGATRTTLRIEVVAAGAAHARCGSGATALKAIGNEAQACAWREQRGWTAEQVVGRVRDRAFVVRVGTDDAAAAPGALREKAIRVAEQVAGILF